MTDKERKKLELAYAHMKEAVRETEDYYALQILFNGMMIVGEVLEGDLG